MAEGETGDKALAAVAYVLTWLTGLIIFFVAKKEDKYARWHAVQAIGLGIALTAVYVLLAILMLMVPAFGVVTWIVWLLALVLIIILAVKAYQGQKVRLPVIADFADKYA